MQVNIVVTLFWSFDRF